MRSGITTDTDRPIEDVFAYVTDQRRAPEWVSGVVETKDVEPPGLGAKATQVVKFLGKRFEFTNEVVEWEPNRKWTFGSRVPFPARMHVTFSPGGNGTRIDAVLEGEVGALFKVVQPVVAAMAKRQL
ncbi:MAG TPA: SRPBCC family protein, partial [Chloroflexota bacterium]